MNRNHALAFALLILALSTARTEVVQFRPCPYEDPNTPMNCTINEVRVNPCREAEEGKPCKLKWGVNAGISFDFTPDFGGSAIQSRAYWATELADLPYLDMVSDACTYTSCPIVPGQKTTYNMSLRISKKYPVRTYDLKWRLWNEHEQECCFMFPIKIRRRQ